MPADNNPARLLAADGPVAAVLPGFQPRAEQQRMAALVAEALANRSALIAEAGTGTGKTLAYAVPAFLFGGRVIISSATTNLQDQLYRRDLPLLRDALGGGIALAVLKGRSRYLCRLRLGRELEQGYGDERAECLAAIEAWDRQSPDGDLDDFSGLGERDQLRLRLTADNDTCLGEDCPTYTDCHVTVARRRAEAADILLVNHALLASHFALREQGAAGLLPSCDAIIVDEAHRLPETVSRSLGVSVSLGGMTALLDDLRLHRVPAQLLDAAEDLLVAARELRQRLGERKDFDWQQRESDTEIHNALLTLRRRAETLIAMSAELSDETGQGSLRRRCRTLGSRLARLDFPHGSERAAWLDIEAHDFRINDAVLDAGAALRRWREDSGVAWIFTSATLALAGDFSHFSARLGASEARCEVFDSPFDYRRQSLLYLPQGLPDPSESAHTDAVTDLALALIGPGGGRSFLLFTSQRALERAAKRLRSQSDLPLLVQGEAPRDTLLRRFREAEMAVLLGCSSFWEGVDVRGSALSCVIIDKLPFSAPDDPIAKAESEAIRRAGGNPFKEWFLPRAQLMLKQGVGRLIRDVDDRGLLVICDPRMSSRGYGKLFLRALPEMGLTRDRDRALAFLRERRGD